MAISPLITIYTPDGKPIAGPVTISASDSSNLTGCYVEGFQHCVYTIQKYFFFALLFGIYFIRKHEPLSFVKQLDKMSVSLMQHSNFKTKEKIVIYNIHRTFYLA